MPWILRFVCVASVEQCVAVCCCVLQCVAVHTSLGEAKDAKSMFRCLFGTHMNESWHIHLKALCYKYK